MWKNSLTNVKNLVATLEFNYEAQIMAIKSNMPRDVYSLCMQYDKLDELKKFLIELFENPRMKSAVPSITPAAEASAFSMGGYVNNDVVSATSDDIGKLKNEIPTLQYKVRRMTMADPRSKQNSKPWKPEVTSPRRKGSSFRGRINVDVSIVMSMDTSLGNVLKRLRMKSSEGSVEWTQNITQMASTQIMMILTSIQMTMTMRCLPL